MKVWQMGLRMWEKWRGKKGAKRVWGVKTRSGERIRKNKRRNGWQTMGGERDDGR